MRIIICFLALMSKKHFLIGGQTRLVPKTSQGHNEIKLKFKSYFVNLAYARCCILFLVDSVTKSNPRTSNEDNLKKLVFELGG